MTDLVFGIPSINEASPTCIQSWGSVPWNDLQDREFIEFPVVAGRPAAFSNENLVYTTYALCVYDAPPSDILDSKRLIYLAALNQMRWHGEITGAPVVVRKWPEVIESKDELGRSCLTVYMRYAKREVARV